MLRWAILGTGFISNTVVDAIHQSNGSTVMVVAGRNAERVAAFQADHNVGRGVTSYDEAIDDPDVDAVYIGVPNHLHHELASKAAAAGKAILSEKSLTATMATAHQLADAVRDTVFFVEGLMYLSHPVMQRFTELLMDGRLGTIRSVSGRYCANISNVVNPEGRGTIYNLGFYPTSLLHLVVHTVFGDQIFAARTSWGAGNIGADGTVTDATLSLRFDNGLLATIASTDDYGMAHDFAVVGDLGVLRFETNPWLPIAGKNVMHFEPHDGEVETIAVTDDHDAFYHQTKVVERGVRNGQTEAQRPSPRLADSLEIMQLLTEWEAHCLA